MLLGSQSVGAHRMHPASPTNSNSGMVTPPRDPMAISNLLNNVTPPPSRPSSSSSTPKIHHSSTRRREEAREEYDSEEIFLLKYDFFLLCKSWSEVERDFVRICPPGHPRRLALDNSPCWVRRSQDGLTSKAYRIRDAGGWGHKRSPNHPIEEEKRRVHAELRRSAHNGEVTPQFIDLLRREQPRYREFPLD